MRVVIVNIGTGPDQSVQRNYHNATECIRRDEEKRGYTVREVNSLSALYEVLDEVDVIHFVVDPEMTEEAGKIWMARPHIKIFVYADLVPDEDEQVRISKNH